MARATAASAAASTITKSEITCPSIPSRVYREKATKLTLAPFSTSSTPISTPMPLRLVAMQITPLTNSTPATSKYHDRGKLSMTINPDCRTRFRAARRPSRPPSASRSERAGGPAGGRSGAGRRIDATLGTREVGGPDQDHEQMHRHNFKRQQVAGTQLFSLRSQIIQAQSEQFHADRPNSVSLAGRVVALADLFYAAAGGHLCPIDHEDRRINDREQQQADPTGQHHLASRRANPHIRAAGGEHDAENQQHHGAADVDQELRRPDEVGPQQEEQTGRRAERNDQPEGHPRHVLTEDDGQRAAAGRGRKDQKQDLGAVHGRAPLATATVWTVAPNRTGSVATTRRGTLSPSGRLGSQVVCPPWR